MKLTLETDFDGAMPSYFRRGQSFEFLLSYENMMVQLPSNRFLEGLDDARNRETHETLGPQCCFCLNTACVDTLGAQCCFCLNTACVDKGGFEPG